MAELVLLAPIAGWVLSIEETPDAVFAERMLGGGVVIDVTGQALHAPCSGVVISVHRAGHAVTIRSAEGAEILMHIGLETVALEGRGFRAHVSDSQIIAAGDLLISMDLDILAQGARSLMSPIVITNGDRFRIEKMVYGCAISVGEPLMTLRGIDPPTAEGSISAGASVSRSVTVSLAHGIHARPAAAIAAAARTLGEISLALGDKTANARSAIAILALGVRCGDEIIVTASGPSAAVAAETLANLIATGIEEGEVTPYRPPAAPRAEAPPAVTDGNSLTGVAAAPGLAIGIATHLTATEVVINDMSAGAQIERHSLEEALATVRRHLESLTAASSRQQRSVIGAHLAFLQDPDLIDAAQEAVAQGASAGRAWKQAIDGSISLVSGAGDARIAERVDDLVDLQRQVLLALGGKIHEAQRLPDRAILLADDLLPSQLIGLDATKLAGICTARGGPTSHVAILAASMGIPALVAVGAGLMRIADGTQVILDVDVGRLNVAPDAATLAEATRTMEAAGRRRKAARSTADEPSRLIDGRRIEVLANLGSLADARAAVDAGAEGCGLLRTEFLFMDRETAPDEEEQLACYQALADVLGDRPLTIRTLDIGGDKPVSYLPIGEEENPALGLRGVRVSLARPDLLRTQLRAILCVRAAGALKIMAPMIASRFELTAVRALVDEIRGELVSLADFQLGAMVETPAAAISADLICGEAEFISLGTNDLSQYTLAMDRGNPAVAKSVDGLHPSVLRMIAAAVEGARAKGRSVSVCGGLASDFAAVPILIGLGVHSLSIVPALTPELKMLIRSLAEVDCQNLAREALSLASPAEVRALAASRLRGEGAL
jgi:phosphocarrier protein FPr/phosphocarrier protein